MRSVFTITIWLLAEMAMHAQQEWGYTQYLFNLYDANAAYAGEHDLVSIALRYRQQWSGLNGAPVTQVVSAHMPLKNPAWAGGVRLMSESIGGRTQVKARLSGGHRWHVGTGHLNVAISAGAWRQQLKTSELTARDQEDPILEQSRITRTVPLTDVAVMYVHDRWFAGIESGGATRSPMQWTDGSTARAYVHFVSTAGWMKKIGARHLLQVSVLGKWAEGNFYQWETNLSFLFFNTAWIGAGYRNQSGISAFTMIQATPRFRFGYSFDRTTNALKQYQSGSHELFLGVSVGSANKPSIRYF
ncbi:MAG: PorP/SprF family type IX secretion system membrane protein [Flavobacteriales bacterium]|nr:PorP/SprF family type IX secretion system membrane protein [Flavobacteriales bacterium]